MPARRPFPVAAVAAIAAVAPVTVAVAARPAAPVAGALAPRRRPAPFGRAVRPWILLA
jgi:hypothetical protein